MGNIFQVRTNYASRINVNLCSSFDNLIENESQSIWINPFDLFGSAWSKFWFVSNGKFNQMGIFFNDTQVYFPSRINHNSSLWLVFLNLKLFKNWIEFQINKFLTVQSITIKRIKFQLIFFSKINIYLAWAI